MKKLFSILLLFCFLVLTVNISNAAVNSYDQYGRKTGSFKKDSSGRVTEYDKYGRKVGSYR